MEYLAQLDLDILIFINKVLQNSAFDLIIPLVRNKFIWLPFYVWIIAYIISKFTLYKASYYILFIISAVAITDVVSGQLLKKTIERPRPCQESKLENIITQRVHCSRAYSFPSSHAVNHFGLALILFTLIGKNKAIYKYLLFSWAAIISFGQMYVGVHYPSDIIAGAILGLLLVSLYIAMIRPIIDRLAMEESKMRV